MKTKIPIYWTIFLNFVCKSIDFRLLFGDKFRGFHEKKKKPSRVFAFHETTEVSNFQPIVS